MSRGALTTLMAPLAMFVTASIPILAAAEAGYPSRAIKFIAPVSPGMIADTIPRLIADPLAAKWGQTVVIENRPGAANNIGAEAVFRAEPDGYTLLVTPPPPLVINPSLYPKLSFDPTAFVPVTVIASVPNVLVARSDLPVLNLEELIAFAKANPDKLSFGSSGPGSTPHLNMEWLNRLAGIQTVHVPYGRGLAPALTDLIAGRIDLMFSPLSDLAELITSGKLKVLAVGSARPTAALPNVPTMTSVFPDFVTRAWFAVVAPPKTPRDIANKLSGAINDVLARPQTVERLSRLWALPVGGSPDQTAALLKEETERWRRVIAAAGIKPQ